MPNFTIIDVLDGRREICDGLLRSLPEWFGIEEAIQDYVDAVENMLTFAAFFRERVVGFISLNIHNKWTAEIHVMAVHSKFHRQGVGKALISFAENYLRGQKIQFLTVKTLAASRPNKEYEITRKFYFSVGFRPIEEFKNLWGKENPCLLMLKSL